MPSPGTPPSTPPRFGPYEVEAELGRGGMGVVYRVRHVATGVRYALKAIHASRLASGRAEVALARFRREAELLARVDAHPGIVRIHAFEIREGAPYCVMELVAGRSLSDVLSREGRLPPEEVAPMVIAVARALHHVHAHGVTHRDLKPENVLIDTTGQPRVVDFGLAYDAVADSLTRTGELLGTPAFMAPEQLKGGDPDQAIGPATDVWALGALLVSALTGQAPFGDDVPPLQLMRAILVDEPPPPSRRVPGLPRALDAIVWRAMRRPPADRYPSAAALADDLERWLTGESIEASPPSALRRMARRLTARSGAPAVVTLLALASLVGAIAMTLSRPGDGDDHAAAGVAERLAVEAAFEAAVRGDAFDLAATSTALAGSAAATDDADGGFTARRSLVDELVRVAGDPLRLRTANLDASPWREHPGALPALLIRSGRADELAALLERQGSPPGPPECIEAIVELLARLDRSPGPALTRAALRAGSRPDADTLRMGPRWDAVIAAVALARVEAILEDEPEPDPDEVRMLADALSRVVPHHLPPPTLPETALDRLGELSRAELGAISETITREAPWLRLGALLLPQEHPTKRELTATALPRFAAAWSSRSSREERSLVALAIHFVTTRTVPWLFSLSDDADVATLLGARAADELARRPERRDVGWLTVYRQLAMARVSGDLGERAVATWRLAGAVLEREATAGDVPGWALVALGGEASRLLTARPRRELSALVGSTMTPLVAADAGRALEPVEAAIALGERGWQRHLAAGERRELATVVFRISRDDRRGQMTERQVVDLLEIITQTAEALAAGRVGTTGRAGFDRRLLEEALELAIRCGDFERSVVCRRPEVDAVAEAIEPLGGDGAFAAAAIGFAHHASHGRSEAALALLTRLVVPDAELGVGKLFSRSAKRLLDAGDAEATRRIVAWGRRQPINDNERNRLEKVAARIPETDRGRGD